MLKNIGLENFKSFDKLNPTDIKPITVLCGTNSSGKSSIIKSLLALKQSWESDHSLNSLALNGKYTKNGKYADVNHKKKGDKIKFENSFQIKSGNTVGKSQSDHFSFILLNKIFLKSELHENNERKIDKRYNTFNIKYIAEFDSTNNYKGMHLRGHNDSILSRTEINIEFTNKSIKRNVSLIMHFNGGDNRFGYSLDYKSMPTTRGYLSNNFSQVNCFFSGLQLTNITDQTDDSDDSFYAVLPSILTIFQVIGEQYGAISYIGPLREEPKRMYVFDEAVVGVGTKGEFAPMVYFSYDFKLYNMPLIENDEILSFKLEDCSFQHAVRYWLSFLDINKVDIGHNDEIIRLLMDNGVEGGVNFADVGFGISQTFPIIVEALRLTKGSTLMLEQPEIHLHPKMQMKLADFFIAMSKFDRELIVETHSDHLINRLVRRIMEDETNQLKEMIGIYFITQIDNVSQINEIKIDQILGIVEWPKDFFDQYTDETDQIMKAGFRNNRKKMVDRQSSLINDSDIDWEKI